MNSLQSCQQTRSGTTVMQIIIGLVTLSFFLIMPGETLAADVAGESRTYMQYRETAAGDKLLPLYEYLDFNVQNLGKESISVHFGGWVGYDLQDDSFGQDKDKGRSVQYGYVSYRTKEHNAVVNLGRVMVFEGVASERLDGVYARTDLIGGFGVSAFGGTSSVIADKPEYSRIHGGRLSHQSAGLYTIGASYVKEDSDNKTFRQEGGIDVSLQPVNKVAVTGLSAYNFQTTGWMEHDYYLILGPFDKLRFNTQASRINYENYFAAATTPALRLTPLWSFLYSKEKVTILGEEVVYTIDKNWTVSVDYKSYGYNVDGNASYSGGKVTYAVPKAYHAGLSFHRMEGQTNALKYQYDEYRIYASKRMNKVEVAIDVMNIKYAEPINNVTNAYSASVAAGYELTEKLKLGLDVGYSKNPDFDKDVRSFAKIIYSFDVASGSRRPAAVSAPEQSAPKAVSEPVAPAAAAPVQAAPNAPVEQAGTPGGTEQGKPKEGN